MMVTLHTPLELCTCFFSLKSSNCIVHGDVNYLVLDYEVVVGNAFMFFLNGK